MKHIAFGMIAALAVSMAAAQTAPRAYTPPPPKPNLLDDKTYRPEGHGTAFQMPDYGKRTDGTFGGVNCPDPDKQLKLATMLNGQYEAKIELLEASKSELEKRVAELEKKLAGGR